MTHRPATPLARRIRTSLLRLALVLGLLPGLAGAEDAPPLRFAISESWTMPLVDVAEHEVRNGILPDIMRSLARQVGRSAEFHLLPRLRIQAALEHGEIDIRCYTAQAWVPTISGDYLWSVPILIQRDVLVAAPDIGPYPEQFDNETVGTVLGYNYPELKHLFDNHNLVREDARNQEQVLRKLIAARYNYAIASQLTLDWVNRSLPAGQRLKIVSRISDQPAACLVRSDPSIPGQQILRTLVRMKQSGEIQAIIDRYTAPQP